MKRRRNIAVIFAGGSGRRMNAGARPKQFLELHGKPIIIYTLELFEKHPEIDAIYIACIQEWIGELQKLCQHYGISKVSSIVPGGSTGQDSIYNALQAAIQKEQHPEHTIVLIHDGVRPLINEQTISDNIHCAQENGTCITCVPAIETFVVKGKNGKLQIPLRENSLIARAPQTFHLQSFFELHQKARQENRHNFIDSLTLAEHYGIKISTVMGPTENIKITTPTDYFIFKAIVEAHENSQIFGF